MANGNGTFDPTKPVKTRDGRKARIITTGADLPQGKSIIAVVNVPNGVDEVVTYCPNGKFMRGPLADAYDLINPSRRVVLTRWVNIWRSQSGQMDRDEMVAVFFTKEAAQVAADTPGNYPVLISAAVPITILYNQG